MHTFSLFALLHTQALERQKEFFDSVRSERDDLREEVVMLKEELKKHGIILSSEVTTNGEASDTLNNVGCPGATKVTKEELNAIEATAGGTLGKCSSPPAPLTCQPALTHLPCVVRCDAVITTRLTATQHAVCPVAHGHLPAVRLCAALSSAGWERGFSCSSKPPSGTVNARGKPQG